MIKTDILKTIQDNIFEICRLTYPFAICYIILSSFVTTDSSPNFLLFINLCLILLESVLLPILIVYLSLRKYEQQIVKKDIYYEGAVHVPYVLMVNILSMLPSLLLVYSMKFISIGLMILMSAISLFLYVKLSFSNFLITLEENKPIDAMKNSFQYTVSYPWEIIRNSIRFLLPLVFVKMLFTLNVHAGAGFNIFSAMGAGIDYLLSIVTCIVLFEIYYHSFKRRKKLA